MTTKQSRPSVGTRTAEDACDGTPSLAELHTENADPWWRDCAERGVSWWAEALVPFTVNDVRDLGVPEPDHVNRWGALFAAMKRHGLIEPVGFTVSTRRSRHGGVLRVWRGVPAGVAR